MKREIQSIQLRNQGSINDRSNNRLIFTNSKSNIEADNVANDTVATLPPTEPELKRQKLVKQNNQGKKDRKLVEQSNETSAVIRNIDISSQDVTNCENRAEFTRINNSERVPRMTDSSLLALESLNPINIPALPSSSTSAAAVKRMKSVRVMLRPLSNKQLLEASTSFDTRLQIMSRIRLNDTFSNVLPPMDFRDDPIIQDQSPGMLRQSNNQVNIAGVTN